MLGNLTRYSSALENSLLTMFVEAVCRKFFYPKWEFFGFFCVGNRGKLILFSFPRARIVPCKRVKANLRGGFLLVSEGSHVLRKASSYNHL